MLYMYAGCHRGDSIAAPALTSTAAPDPMSMEWIPYRDEALGIQFYYPGDAGLKIAQGAAETSITGPGGWPAINILDNVASAEFEVPEAASLEDWVIRKYLLIPTTRFHRQPAEQIAGTRAIHIRTDSDPRIAQALAAWPADTFFFVKPGHLYVLTFAHAFFKEDWAFYLRFLRTVELIP
jgi:hypothetical protein